MLDEAEAVLRAPMRTGDMHNRIRAAAFFLRNTEARRRRFGG